MVSGHRLLIVCAFALAVPASAQGTQIPIPTFTNTYSQPSHSRGFWFTSPADFTIVGLRVPDETAHGMQNVEVFNMPTPPTGSSSGASVFYMAGQPSANIIPCSIQVATGDHIGVLGTCGTTTMHNSYGAGPFASMIAGQSVQLTRFITQNNIYNAPAPNYQASTGSLARVEVYILEGPSCSINSPAPGATVMATVGIDYDVDHVMMLPVDASFDFSIDGGMTWSPATPGGMSTNPRTAIATPSTGLTFEWDSLADAVGLVMIESADVRVSVTDGMVTTVCSVTNLQVDNVVPPPTCTLSLTNPGPQTAAVSLDLIPDSSTAMMVDATFEFSLDSGATWQLATPTGGSANPILGAPIMTLTQFDWDSNADGVGMAALAPGVLVRATVDSGAPLTGECTTMPFDVDNTALCQGICGDCDLNAAGPSIIDALTAAQISAGLITPTMAQLGCCDVNSSMNVDILDALSIAQAAAALPVTLTCP